jgi:hypothetical protein
MRTAILSAVLTASIALFAQGCASESASSDESSTGAADLTSVSGAHAHVLADALAKANAPSNTPPHMLGMSSHIARIGLQTAQGGIAHFISESGSLSTVDGDDLGDLVTLGLSWSDLRDALVAGGAKMVTVQGDHGASSSSLLATVECKQVVSPSAQPTCTVTPITLSDDDNKALDTALLTGGAPSTATGLGVGSNEGRIELTTAQGGTAHFISQSATLSTVDGKHLADISDLGVSFKDLETALLDAGLAWKTTNGPHMSSSSTMSATVSCHRVVSPGAKPTCSVFSF